MPLGFDSLTEDPISAVPDEPVFVRPEKSIVAIATIDVDVQAEAHVSTPELVAVATVDVEVQAKAQVEVEQLQATATIRADLGTVTAKEN